MTRLLVLAMAGASGDLQPLMAASIAMRERGHQLDFLGDDAVARAVAPLRVTCIRIPPDLDMGRILCGVFIRLAGMTLEEQGAVLREEIDVRSQDVGALVNDAIAKTRPDMLITSLFGVGAAAIAASSAGVPWAMINSTFYVGPNPPRPLSADFGPRAIPLIEYFLPIIEGVPLALHATDQVFDFDFAGLPPNHHYVGPLIWEPDDSAPEYLDEPGDPWVLVTTSSQAQDDVPIVRAALDGLESLPVRVLVTTGGSHQLTELGSLPANARAESHTSHAAVLARTRALVSHAGHGSVMKALWYGVPMVLVPWGRDQPGVAARAARLGVAQVIPRERLDPTSIREAVRQLLENSAVGEAAGTNSARLSATNPATEAVNALEAAIG